MKRVGDLVRINLSTCPNFTRARDAVVVFLSVCLSVCVSVTYRYFVEMAARIKLGFFCVYRLSSSYDTVCLKYLQTRNAWQSLAYSPLGAVVSPPSEY